MTNGFDEIPSGIKNILVHVAEFSCRNNEYIEGPRLLAQARTYDTAEKRTEDTTYNADGSVHSKVVTTGDADHRRSIIYRYRLDGRLRDKWLITYNNDGSRAHAYIYDSQGKRQEVQLEEEETTTFFDPEQMDESGESVEREFDVRGNWVKETRFEKKIEGGELVDVPTMVTYRTISYL
jgi:YD repeat-containing protein